MSKDGYYGDFDSLADEQRAYEEQQQQQYLEECGACPNCGNGVHISELGNENGITCCKYCYQSVIDNLVNVKDI